MMQLELAASDLLKLAQHVDAFAKWWLDMDVMLGELESRIERMQGQNVLTWRVNTAKRGWTRVKEDYLEYKVKVCVRILPISSPA